MKYNAVLLSAQTDTGDELHLQPRGAPSITTGMGDQPPAAHLARLVAQSDRVRRRLIWWAECPCGWTSPSDPDSTAVLRHAGDHDGLSLSLVDRGFTVIGPDDAA